MKTLIILVCILASCLSWIYAPRSGGLPVSRRRKPFSLNHVPQSRELRGSEKIIGARSVFPTRLWRRSSKQATKIDVGMLAAETATHMEAGSSMKEAWSYTLRHRGLGSPQEHVLDSHGVPPILRRLWEEHENRGTLSWLRKRRDTKDNGILGIPAIIAICRLSYQRGAPAVTMLNSCVQGLSESARAASERRIAIAGAMSSVKLLAILPFCGVFLGYALGANPLKFLFTSPLGVACFVVGTLCEICGLLWIRKLVERAKKWDS